MSALGYWKWCGALRVGAGSNMMQLGGEGSTHKIGKVLWDHTEQRKTCHEVVSLGYLKWVKTFHLLEVNREARIVINVSRVAWYYSVCITRKCMPCCRKVVLPSFEPWGKPVFPSLRCKGLIQTHHYFRYGKTDVWGSWWCPRVTSMEKLYHPNLLRHSSEKPPLCCLHFKSLHSSSGLCTRPLYLDLFISHSPH